MVIFPLSPLKAKKSDNYRYRDSWITLAITLEREPSKKKQRTDTSKQRGLRVITLQGAKDKSSILLLQYW